MPNWECPRCHVANLPEDDRCRACNAPRPPDWEDATWVCERCGEENPNRQNYCEKCGFRLGFDWSRGRDAGMSGELQRFRAGVERLRRGILDDIRGELEASLADAAASVDALREGGDRREQPSAAAPVTGARSPLAWPGSRSRTTGAAPLPFRRVTTRHLEVRVTALPKLNYALLHAGLALVQTLQITNTAKEPAHDVLVRAWVAPDYGEPWQRSIASIAPGASHVERDIIVPLRKVRLQEVREAERANLRIEVLIEGTVQFSETYSLEVLPYNEWYYHPAIPQTAACFVQPNSPAVEKIVTLVRDRLRRDGWEADLSGYQSGRPERVVTMAAALYATIQQDLGVSYINPPPSFEQAVSLPDGGYTVSQKVFFPEQILEHRRGTCLDLALLCASCLERMGLHPLFFLIRGHALFGVWLRERELEAPVLRDHTAVTNLLEGGEWLALNSTTFAVGQSRPFEACRDEARVLLSDASEFRCVVDIVAARRAGLKPIPPIVQGA